MNDSAAMRLALAQATAAGAAGEVPVGAVVVRQGEVIATGCNASIGQNDPSAHAEIVALRAAALALGNYRLDDCELFVTLEPCAMCAGAMLHARLKRVVFGAFDPKTGAAGSVLDLFANAQLNHQTALLGGVLANECAAQLKEFFRQQRQEKLSAAEPLREDALRTPAGCFEALPQLPGDVRYFRDLPSLEGLRLHVTDSGPPESARATLCLHGCRSWSLAWCTVMRERAARGERVLAVDLIGFGKSDKLKKLSGYAPQWHLQVLVELVNRLKLEKVLVLEPADDSVPGERSGQTLGQALMLMLPEHILGRESAEIDVLDARATNAPYPDQGHRAALNALLPRAIKP
jgi:tRNA(adenine34) deaminase